MRVLQIILLITISILVSCKKENPCEDYRHMTISPGIPELLIIYQDSTGEFIHSRDLGQDSFLIYNNDTSFYAGHDEDSVFITVYYPNLIIDKDYYLAIDRFGTDTISVNYGYQTHECLGRSRVMNYFNYNDTTVMNRLIMYKF